MAAIKGTNVIAPVVPLDTTDVHPSHEARYGKGGYRTVATLVERDAIPAPRREAGMLVYVSAGGGSLWQLGGDLTTWTAFESGGSADLPPGTEGDVLTYVAGEWVAAEPQGGVSSWNDLTDKPSTFPPSAHAASHGPNGADELYDQSLNTADAPTFAEITVSPDATTTATYSGDSLVVTTSPAVQGQPNNERTAFIKTSTSNGSTPAGEFGVVAAADNEGYPVAASITGAAAMGDGAPAAALLLRAEEPNNSTLNQCYINATAPLYGDAAVTMYTTANNYAVDRYATYGTAGIVIVNTVGGRSEIRIDAAGITFPDNTFQTTAWPGTLSYTALTDLPTLGTAASSNVPATGNAGSTEVVLGSDTRLTDARTPASHSHGSLTNDGKIGTTADRIVVTGTGGALTTAATISSASVSGLGGAALLNIGTTAGTVAAGNDARLSDARTPLAHNHSGLEITSGTVAAARLPTVLEQTVTGGNTGTSVTLSLASGSVQTWTLTGNCTFTMPSASAGASLTIILTQNGTHTAAFTGVLWSGGTAPTITATASKRDILVFVSDGTSWYGTTSQNH